MRLFTKVSWLKKYYPFPAKAFGGLPRTKRRQLQALNHSLRKWLGLKAIVDAAKEARGEAMPQHTLDDAMIIADAAVGLVIRGGGDVYTPHVGIGPGRRVLEIDRGSCALCVLSANGGYVSDARWAEIFCKRCVLKGGCDKSYWKRDHVTKSPWQQWMSDHDPNPMIRLLKSAIRKLQCTNSATSKAA